MNLQFWRVWLLVTTTVVTTIGCRETSPPSDPVNGTILAADFRRIDPETLLRTTFARYRAAESYRDRAQVRLVYDHETGRRESQVAPLSVQWDGGNFFVRAYSLRCFCDGETTWAWIRDDSTNDFDHQVTVGGAPRERGQWERLTLDPIFQQHLSAGLGGPPPQLDWLFAAEPMTGLFDERHRFERGSIRSIEGHDCLGVIVDADARRYTFWIDPAENLIREVQLPGVIGSPSPGQPVQEMSLTVELARATFDAPTSPPEVEPLPEHPRLVDRFVPLPPEKPHPALGRKIERSVAERLGHREHPSRAISILVWHPHGAVSSALVGLLNGWREHLPDDLRSRVRLASPDRGQTDRGGEVDWLAISPDELSQAFSVSEGGVAIVDQRGTLAWIQTTLVAAELPSLGRIVADALDGVDIPGRLRREWQAAQAAYHEELVKRAVR